MSARTATVSWTANTELTLAGYRIYYGTAPGLYSQQVDVGLTATPSAPSFTINPPWPSSGKWFFSVTAYNTSNLESPHSVEVSKAIPVEVLQAARM